MRGFFTIANDIIIEGLKKIKNGKMEKNKNKQKKQFQATIIDDKLKQLVVQYEE